MLYLWVKVFHIVFMVSWMAGLFYLPRLFVYHAESLTTSEPGRSILGTQFTHMEKRLYAIIMQPAMLLTWELLARRRAIRDDALPEQELLRALTQFQRTRSVTPDLDPSKFSPAPIMASIPNMPKARRRPPIISANVTPCAACPSHPPRVYENSWAAPARTRANPCVTRTQATRPMARRLPATGIATTM